MRQNVFVCLFVDFYLAIRFICHTFFFFSTSKHIRTLNNFIIFNVQIGYYLVFESKRRPFENVTTVKYFSLKLTTSNGNVCVCILFLLLSCERCPGFCYTCSQIYFKFFFHSLYTALQCVYAFSSFSKLFLFSFPFFSRSFFSHSRSHVCVCSKSNRSYMLVHVIDVQNPHPFQACQAFHRI